MAQIDCQNQKNQEVQGCQVRQEVLEGPEALEDLEGLITQIHCSSGSRLESHVDQLEHQVAQEGQEVLVWCLKRQEDLVGLEVQEAQAY